MKKRLGGFIWMGLGVSLLLALFLSPFASSSLDGLEKVAETKGFLEKGEDWTSWKYAPFSDYSIPWIKNEKVSTALSGLIGTLAIFFLAMGIGKVVRKSSNQRMTLFIAFPLVIFSTLILTSTFLHAARPLTTDDAWTVERGRFQVETGFDFLRQDNHDQEISPSLALSYGLFEKMDMGIGSSYLFVRPKEGDKENGFGDTEVKLKYLLFGEKGWIPAFAISGILKIPTASESKGLGSGKTDFGLNTIITKNLSKRWVLHLNLGYTFIGEHGVNNEFNYSAAAQFILSDKWALVGEIVGVDNFNGQNGDDPISGLLGSYYLITDNIIWDIGVDIGMSKAAPDFRLTTGLTLLFKP